MNHPFLNILHMCRLRIIHLLFLPLILLLGFSCASRNISGKPTPAPSPLTASFHQAGSALMDSPCPKWRVDNGSGGLSKHKGPDTPELFWQFKSGGAIRSCPVVDDRGNIYFGSYDSSLYCVSPKGKKLWSLAMGEWIDSTGALAADGNIFVGCDDGTLAAVDKKGGLLWRYDLRAEISSSPSIAEKGLIFAGSEDGSLYAFDNGGKVCFTFKTGGRILVSSPLIDKKGAVIFGSEDGHVYAVSQEGTLLWKYQGRDSVVFNSPPVLNSAGNIIFSTPSRKLVCLGPDGRLLWETNLHEEIFEPLAADSTGRTYGITLDGVLLCHNGRGKPVWKYWIGEEPAGGPSIDSAGRIFVAGKGSLVCLDSKGGKLWSAKFPGRTFSTSPVIGEGGTLYVGTLEGNLVCIGKRKF